MFEAIAETTINHPKMIIKPYCHDDRQAFIDAFDNSLLTWFVRDYVDADDYIGEKLSVMQAKSLVFFVFIDPSHHKVIGSSCVYDIQSHHRAVEIGSTWIAKDYQGTGYNALSKYLLINALMQKLVPNRIQLKADARNIRSITAMQKIGLEYEGCLKKHMLIKDNFVRDTAFFSVTESSWHNFKQICCQWIQDKLGVVF